MPGQPCSTALDCASVADGACISGSCLVFSEAQGFGSAVVDLSFAREIPKVPSSGQVLFIDSRRATGVPVDCDDILNGLVALDDQALNPLMAEPKYLVFNCCGTFFPNNLIQFIRPSESALAVALGYERLGAQGDLTTMGCSEGIRIVKDQALGDLVISLKTL